MSQKSQAPSRMSAPELRAAFSLAGIFSLRMLGLFLILPVFALYADQLQGVTPLLVGVAIGAYGLTQALLQIPFGMLSDRIGRKPVIIGGLVLFAVGSAVAATADSIWGVILGRALQGSGAIAAAVMALAADLTREEHRTKAMAVIGLSIGIAFAVAMVAGPILDRWIGVAGIFWLTAVLALVGIAIVLLLVPGADTGPVQHRDTGSIPDQFGRVLGNLGLLRLDFGILSLHMILSSLFLVVPLALERSAGLDSGHHWLVYLPVMLLAMLIMVPFVVVAEKRRKMKPVFVGAVAALGLALLLLYWLGNTLWGIGGALLLFFTAFNLLEATLPSLISKVAPVQSKGTAMGVYSTSQFLGAFLGGFVGGWVHARFGLEAVYLFGALAALTWFAVAFGMAQPPYLSSRLLSLGEFSYAASSELERRLLEIPGVADACVSAQEGLAYLKVDVQLLDEAALEAFTVPAEPIEA